jgi:hypothetical protein
MTTALDRRLQALEASTQRAEPQKMELQYVNPTRGVVSVRLPDGQHLARNENESEAAFLVRVEAAR